MAGARRWRGVIPGFGPTMGLTLTYLSLLVWIPLAALFVRAAEVDFATFWGHISSPRALASYRLTVGTSLVAALANLVFGLLLAWSLVRYDFPGRRLVDAMIDLPFALPTAVAGISLTAIYSRHGWLGQYLEPAGLTVAFTSIGIVVALAFVGLPFVVRTVQPVLQDLDPEVEEAAATLGALRVGIFWRVLLPALMPSLCTGFSLAFARGLGEYGSVVFISGNLPFKTEITTLLIMTRLEQYDYGGATAIATLMLVVSFALLLVINLTQRLARRYEVRS